MKGSRGFTMTELLVAMAIAAVVMATVFSAYKSQQDSYVVQEQVTETQQNLRAALYMMSRDIRMAGYDPTGKASNTGFLGDLLGTYSNDAEFNTDNNEIAFALDDDGDAQIDVGGDNDALEQCAYRLSPMPKPPDPNPVLRSWDPGTNYLQKYIPGQGWVNLAEYIDALNFVYLGEVPASGTTPVLDPAGTPADLRRIRSVQITLVARARDVDNKFEYRQTVDNLQGNPIFNDPQQDPPDHYRRRILSTTIQCRNMGL